MLGFHRLWLKIIKKNRSSFSRKKKVSMLLDISWTFWSVWMLKAIWAGVCSCCSDNGRWHNAWSDALLFLLCTCARECCCLHLASLTAPLLLRLNRMNSSPSCVLLQGSGGTVPPQTDSACWKSDGHLIHLYLSPSRSLLVCCQFQFKLPTASVMKSTNQGADCK